MTDSVLRTMEHKGTKYAYGYAIIFDTPDSHGTIATKQFVESNEARLRQYPAVRFMHSIPLGQIEWDKDLGGGIRTFIDDHGFHVLARVYDERDKEFQMIKEGNWGWSFGSRPDGWGKRCIGNKCYPSFEKGVIYEVSIVDSPSHIDSTASTIERSLDGNGEPTDRIITFGLDEMFAELDVNRSAETRNISENYQDHNFPETCDVNCEHRTCAFFKPQNWGRACFHRVYKIPENP